ncbi:MAG TPA: NUDIX domain-containing protein [Acidimicrobiales bacterium]|nr:NUDIX domain-containing protein [Acidimicrobiales bacterium]
MTRPQPAVQIRDAATVMLVRDEAQGMEVFMLRRNLDSDFVGGAYVFPGGAVDEADRHADLSRICTGRTDEQASDQLGIPKGGLAYWVAAVRECFEEAGVLLAVPDGGADDHVISFAEPSTAARFTTHRHDVDHGRRRLIEVCEEEGLRLDVDRIHYFSHWITPEGPPRRYDTRFFVAAAPPEQVPLHDDRETIANLWVRPQDALERHARGELDLILPTIKNLEAIGRFDRSADLLAHAATISSVPAILPRIVHDGGGMRILLPDDAGYGEAVGAIPAGTPMPGRPGGPAIAGA